MKGGRLLAAAAELEKPELDFRLSAVDTLHAVEQRYIEAVLEAVGGNKQRAAALLGISRKTVYRRLGLLKN